MSNQPLTLDLSVVRLRNNDVVTDSRKVASVFGKQHKTLLRCIENLDCSSEFFAAQFCATKYELRGREYKNYEMTKDGFMFLVMGFTGDKAARIKEAYINAFNTLLSRMGSNYHAYIAKRADSELLHARLPKKDTRRAKRRYIVEYNAEGELSELHVLPDSYQFICLPQLQQELTQVVKSLLVLDKQTNAGVLNERLINAI